MGFFSSAEIESRPLPIGLSMSNIMRQVYLWLMAGLLVAFGIAFVLGAPVRGLLNVYLSGDATITELIQLERAIASSPLLNPVLSIGALIAYFILGFALQPIIMRANTTVGAAFYFLFTALFGYMLGGILLAYRIGDIMAAFIATAGMFGVMSFLGYTTKIDLSRFGSIFIMALIGLLIASIVNIFLRSPAVTWVITYAGVLIFAGLTAYDTQWIKNNAAAIAETGDQTGAQRIALIGAFHLFLDFVNLFLYLLRVFSNRE
ncbi:MAG: Bax inhibitor-1/YccA family protein [Chloroflexi bacterium]|jgi:FtsH-binding integral membrane protein|nr:Bax inhibitor-1/YccA family protein [Chloroflexota bacterium]